MEKLQLEQYLNRGVENIIRGMKKASLTNPRSAVFLVVIIHQLHSNLRICGRIKRISPAEELLLQLLVILDNAVMHSCHISVITDMRMGIDL